MVTKKAQGLSISTVIIAAIGLVILVVLVLIFSGRIGLFNEEVTTCPANAPNPVNSPDQCAGLPAQVIEVEGVTQYCCKELSS